MLHCWRAIVAPRPTASLEPGSAIAGARTTLVDGWLALSVAVPAPQLAGNPAARQMLAQMPPAV